MAEETISSYLSLSREKALAETNASPNCRHFACQTEYTPPIFIHHHMLFQVDWGGGASGGKRGRNPCCTSAAHCSHQHSYFAESIPMTGCNPCNERKALCFSRPIEVQPQDNRRPACMKCTTLKHQLSLHRSTFLRNDKESKEWHFTISYPFIITTNADSAYEPATLQSHRLTLNNARLSQPLWATCLFTQGRGQGVHFPTRHIPHIPYVKENALKGQATHIWQDRDLLEKARPDSPFPRSLFKAIVHNEWCGMSWRKSKQVSFTPTRDGEICQFKICIFPVLSSVHHIFTPDCDLKIKIKSQKYS